MLTAIAQWVENARGAQNKILRINASNQVEIYESDGTTLLSTTGAPAPQIYLKEWHSIGPAVVWNPGTGDGETAWARVPASGPLTHLSVLTPAALDGDVTIELVNLTTAFTANPSITAPSGQSGATLTEAGFGGLTVAENDILVIRITALAATNAADVTLGYQMRIA